MAAAIYTRVTQESLKASARLHNEYPPDTAMPTVDMSSDGVKELCRIITKFRLQEFIRLRLLHRHFYLQEGQILLERSVQQGYWTELTLMKEVVVDEVHGHIFSVKEDTLSPTEFRHGPTHLALDNDFLAEFAQALRRNHLDKVLGIEVARDGVSGNMLEFSSDRGSVLQREENMNLAEEGTAQCTGWVVTDDGLVDQTGETRCHIMNGKHIRITSSQINHI